ncbi:MAG TPA: transcription antitermination factor NusB, partial [Candidatus Limnocylindria bacterium]|nr:transcription antitermination factor NusB [Candidatus Limnocylindria bacterium]
MAARSKARKRALDILFECDQRSADPLATLADRVALGDPPVNPYTVTIVEGVVTEGTSLDQVIGEASRDWSVDRMPAVDRAVLRIGVWELLHGDVPTSVAIDEAVELCKSLSTDESPAFVNGVLSRVLQEHPR